MTETYTSDEISNMANTVESRSPEDDVKETIDSYIQKQLTYTYRILLQELQEMVLQEEDNLNATLEKNPKLKKADALEAAEKHFSEKEKELRQEYRNTKAALLKHRDYLYEESQEYFFYLHAFAHDGINPC